MVNWQDHGVALSSKDMPWVDQLYAPDCVYSNGKYYLFFPNRNRGIGVAVSETPYGPFKDALGKALIDRETPGVEGVQQIFDPCVLIDDDGQAYIYFGGGSSGDNLRVAKLKPNLLELDGPAISLDLPLCHEGLFVHKRNGKYYLSYPQKKGATIVYHMSDQPMTGWQYKGIILPNPSEAGGNSHHSIVEYNEQWYMFYHNRKVARERGEYSMRKRSINVDYLYYNTDGTIKEVVATSEGVKQLKPIDAFTQNEAEMFDREEQIEIEFASEGGVNVTDIQNGDWIKYSGVDFGSGANKFHARVASDASGGQIELRIGSPDGKLIGTCNIPNTKGKQKWETASCKISGANGQNDLYLKFTGTADTLFNLNWWKFDSDNN